MPVYCSGDLVGKVENGQRAPTEEFTAACDAVLELGTDGALGRLRQLLRIMKHRAYPGSFHRWPDKDASAKTLRTFELVAVPGLLQTEGYARPCCGPSHGYRRRDRGDGPGPPGTAGRPVLMRASRPMLWVIIDEGVLRRPVGGPDVMHEQLIQMAEAARRPNIVLQVIPLAVGAHQGMSGNFVIADFADAPSVVYQDTAARGQIVEDADDVATVTVMWDTLHSEALPRSASLGLVEEAAKLRHGPEPRRVAQGELQHRKWRQLRGGRAEPAGCCRCT